MNKKQRIDYLRIALGLSGIVINNANTDKIIRINDILLHKKGKTDISDVARIEAAIQEEYYPKRKRVTAHKTKKP